VLIFELVQQAIRPIAAVHLIRFDPTYPPSARYLGWSFDAGDSLGKCVSMLDPLGTTLVWMPRQAGLVIGGAWLSLILAGAWRPEPSSIDRAGRTVGFFWIVAACHFLLLPL
jgi:hypothetical protein